jgi:beta-N-acetylhexosaminidase
MKRLLFWVLSFACFWGQAQTPDLLDIKIGQMILIGMPRAEVDPLVLDEVKKGKVGALIFFEKIFPTNLMPLLR